MLFQKKNGKNLYASLFIYISIIFWLLLAIKMLFSNCSRIVEVLALQILNPSISHEVFFPKIYMV